MFVCIEGLHDVVHSTILSCSLFSLLQRSTEKNKKKQVLILDSLHYRISNFTQVCVLLFSSLGCSLVLWYNLNKKFWDILFSYTKPMWSGNQHGGRPVRWLAIIGFIWHHMRTPYCLINPFIISPCSFWFQMDDITTDRSLSQLSQNGNFDYMEEAQVGSWLLGTGESAGRLMISWHRSLS